MMILQMTSGMKARVNDENIGPKQIPDSKLIQDNIKLYYDYLAISITKAANAGVKIEDLKEQTRRLAGTDFLPRPRDLIEVKSVGELRDDWLVRFCATLDYSKLVVARMFILLRSRCSRTPRRA